MKNRNNINDKTNTEPLSKEEALDKQKEGTSRKKKMERTLFRKIDLKMEWEAEIIVVAIRYIFLVKSEGACMRQCEKVADTYRVTNSIKGMLQL